ncbi:MAG: FkbM family methyltransferase [Saprospiraceae bacterium]
MNNKADLLTRLNKIEQLSKGTRWRRLLHQPYRYLKAMFFWKLTYNRTKKGSLETCETFFNSEMEVILPAGMDLYLLGAKSHDSEIRLAKYFIRQIQEGQVVLDIGTHFGYYALLAHHLVGQNGRVIGIEASRSIWKIANKNAMNKPELVIFNGAATSKRQAISFFEFPILYSEYNTIYPNQFEKSKWLKENKPQKVTVNGSPMDDLMKQLGATPDFIKIDVEGAEYDVILGLQEIIQQNSPIIAMEYLVDKRSNQAHKKAVDLLKTYGYQIHFIDKDGALILLGENTIEAVFESKNVESDNIVLCK